MTGSASVKTHLQALHYKDVRDLRRGPDGQWTGKATQGNVQKTVTIAPRRHRHRTLAHRAASAPD